MKMLYIKIFSFLFMLKNKLQFFDTILSKHVFSPCNIALYNIFLCFTFSNGVFSIDQAIVSYGYVVFQRIEMCAY